MLTAAFITLTVAVLAGSLLAVLHLREGAALLAARLRRGRVPGALIAVHAMIAVSGFVVLAAYYFAG